MATTDETRSGVSASTTCPVAERAGVLRRWIWLPHSHYGPSAARSLAGSHEIANPAKSGPLID
ncbi:hypothetical protein VTN00DRAFT_1261 [Thermoascus crustaceus]|uniref:uncharacterized protein n=1 Tax=Thermoascus crustaceus TaxID=5088 RepID=UPI00374314B9